MLSILINTGSLNHKPLKSIVFLFLFQTVQNGDIIPGIPVTPEDHEDLSEYKFQKFATTYFQGNVTHQYSKKPLKHPLLPLQTQGDQLVRMI